jgi:hypothetical protein
VSKFDMLNNSAHIGDCFLPCVVKFRDLFFLSVWDSGCIKAGARCNHLLPDEDVTFIS